MIDFDVRVSNVVARIYHCSQGMSEVDFKGACIDLVLSLIPFDSAVWKESSPYSKKTYFFLYNTAEKFKSLEHELSEYLRKKGYDSEEEAICFPSSKSVQDEFYRTNLYKHLRPFDVEHVLKYSSRKKLDTTFHELSLYRNKSQQFYTPIDIELFELLMPHVFQAYQMNKVYAMNNCVAGVFIYRAVCDRKFNVLEADDAIYGIFHSCFKQNSSTEVLPIERLQKVESIDLKVESYKDLYYIEICCPSKEFNSLTPKEKEIVELVYKRFNNDEISAYLSISPKTLSNHFNNIYMKFQAKSKTEIISKLSTFPSVNL